MTNGNPMSHVGAAAPVMPELCLHQDCRRIRGHSGSHNKFPKEAWEFLDQKDKNKIDKAGYATPRGGDKGAYQNHVYRNNRVIVPFERLENVDLASFSDGYVIRLNPDQYFDAPGRRRAAFDQDPRVVVGANAFVLYRSHETYEQFPPLPEWTVRKIFDADGNELTKRTKQCIDRGHYVLRLPAVNGRQANNAGAPQGIFAPEYADAEKNYLSQAVLAWLAVHTVRSPFTEATAQHLKAILTRAGLGDIGFLNRRGVMNNGLTVCPLCTRPIKYSELHESVSFDDVPGLENAAVQIEGVNRSTVVNLFHMEPLLYGRLAHLPMNVAWGHATCNTKLGQRHCYSLAELIDDDLKVAVLRGEEAPQTFGWISPDFEMIRSDSGAVWIRLVGNASDPGEELAEELSTILAGGTD